MSELKIILVYLCSFILLGQSQDNPSSSDLTWVETDALGMTTGGNWLRKETCPPGSFVTDYTIRFDNTEDRGFNNSAREIIGLTLRCSELDQNYKLQRVASLSVNGNTDGHQSTVEQSKAANRYAVGFSIARWMDVEGLEYVDGRKLTFIGENETEPGFKYKFPRKSASNARINATLFSHIRCPDNWAICGVQGRTKSNFQSGSESEIVTELRFKCCYYCLPIEQKVILDDYTNYGSTDYVWMVRKTEGVQITSEETEARSASKSSDKAGETQNSNSVLLTEGKSTVEGETATKSNSQGSNSGWLTGEDLRVSSSTQNSKGNRLSTGKSSLTSNSKTQGRSESKIDENHWSKTKSTSSVAKWDAGGSVGINIGFFSFNPAGKYEKTDEERSEETEGGRQQTQSGTTHEETKGNQEGTSTDVTNETNESFQKGSEKNLNSNQSGGNTTNSERGLQKSVQEAKESSMQEGAQTMFSKRHSQSSAWSFNWGESKSSMWRKEQEYTSTFTCAPMSRCKVEQIYGTCGGVRIATPHINKIDTPLKYKEIGGSFATIPSNTTPHKEMKWEIKIPGETWVVAKDLSYWEPSGRWENILVCPPNTVVTGHSLRFLGRVGLTGITVVCTPKYGKAQEDAEGGLKNTGTYLRISPGNKKNDTRRNLGEWGQNYVGSRQNFAEGFSAVRMELDGRRSMGNFEVKHHQSDLLLQVPNWAQNSSRVNTSCPVDHAICGVTAMLDKESKGVITGLGFKCCHHCVPIERWINIQEYTNRGFLEQRREVRTTIGLQKITTNTTSRSKNGQNTVDSAGLQAGFSARFGLSNTTGFDWTHTEQSVWREETMVTEFYVCEAGMYCKYRNLIGECGSVRIPVNKFEKIAIPLDAPTSTSEVLPESDKDFPQSSPAVAPYLTKLENEPTPVEILHNGEIWVEALNMQLLKSQEENPVDRWASLDSCPPGSFVTGYAWQHHPESTPDNILRTGVSFLCSKWNSKGAFVPLSVIPSETLSSQKSGATSNIPQSTRPLVGLQYLKYEWEDETSASKSQAVDEHLFITDTRVSPGPRMENHVLVTPVKVTCPTDYVVCGLGTRLDSNTGLLNNLRLKCCYHCEPTETLEELNTMENTWSEVVTKQSVPNVVVGAQIQADKTSALVQGTQTLRKSMADYNHLKTMFAHRLPKNSRSRLEVARNKFDWGKQAQSLWTSESIMSFENRCKFDHHCVLKQLVGVCKSLKIPTSFVRTESTPLDQLKNDDLSGSQSQENN